LIDDNDIFCASCGINLIAQTIVKDIDKIVEDIDRVVKTPLTLDSETIASYMELETQIDNLSGIETELTHQKNYHNELNILLQNSCHRLQQLSIQREKEFRDVEKLKSLTVSSILARIKGDRDEKINKEELEYLNALNKEESEKNEVNDLEHLISNTYHQVKELEKILEHKNRLKTSLEGLIHEICEGVPDPIEDQIEQKLKRLVEEINPLSIEKGSVLRGQSHLRNAEYNLSEALKLLDSASNYSDWDTFFGGGMFVDSIKHSRMAEARDFVHKALNNIQLASKELPGMPWVDQAHVEEISYFWDGFMDNIFSDFSSRGKIQRSRNSVIQSLDETNNALNWVNNRLVQINQQYSGLEREIGVTRQNLLDERKRMIKDAIARKT
jgi:hypothetical protein